MLRQKLAVIEEKRGESGPLPGGTAPPVSSNNYKTKSPGTKPEAERWDHRFSSEALRQSSSAFRGTQSSKNPRPLISLGTARPAPQYFPWESMVMNAVPKDHFGKAKSSTPQMPCTKGESGYDLGVAMNYGYSAGSPQALRFITEHVEMIHNPPYADWECSITCGSTSAMEIAFRMFCNPSDWIILEENAYPGTLFVAKALGLKVLGVKMDGNGLLASDLDYKLRNWDTANGPKPFVLYTVPCGQNPTGATQDEGRRKEIYQIAVEHNLYIIEDDPYYFLHLGDETNEITSDSDLSGTALDDFLAQLPPSYLSLDVSGRVMRMESASKVLAPGLRCGWVTASSQVIDKFFNHTEAGVFAPSGPSQVILYKLLDETWGHEGFLSWLMHLANEYRLRRDIIIDACNRYLPTDLCHWVVPSTGMFLWIDVDLPDVDGSKSNIEDRIHAGSLENGVVISKGSWFAAGVHAPLSNGNPTNGKLADEERSISFRITFAAAPEESLSPAVEMFALALLKELQLP